MKPIRIVFFGTPSFVVQILESLLRYFDVIGVVTTADTIQGRKKLLTPSPIKVFAKQHNIQVLQPDKLSTINSQLSTFSPDLFVVAAYGKLVSKNTLAIPKFGALNVHPSLLPKYRGPSPVQTALLHGDTVSGVTIIKMDEEMDHGPIIAQWKLPISRTDTAESLHYRLFQDAADKLPGIIKDYIKGKITPVPQDDSQATYCQKITKEHGFFESANPPPAEKFDHMIRALYPWPTVWTKIPMANGKWKIVKFLPEKRIQMEGKKAMTVKEFLNGYPELTDFIKKVFGKTNLPE